MRHALMLFLLLVTDRLMLDGVIARGLAREALPSMATVGRDMARTIRASTIDLVFDR